MRILLLILSILSVFAHPIPLTVIHGDVSFSSCSNQMKVKTSDKAVIEWKQFNIEPNETLEFIQPSIISTTLINILDQNPSTILGKIKANGRIILTNSKGIFFGQESSLYIGSLITSTFDLPYECFLQAGVLKFSGDTLGKIEVLGNIHAQNAVCMIGHEICHKGHIEYKKNGGLLGGTGVHLEANTFKPLSIGTRHPESFSLTELEGTILSPGGSIYITGERLFLKNGSLLDVSHNVSPGLVMIGGISENQRERAESIFFERGATIDADCKIAGNGGSVYLMSELANSIFGMIFARGGKHRGDGGFIKLLGPFINYPGYVDISAREGNDGMLSINQE